MDDTEGLERVPILAPAGRKLVNGDAELLDLGPPNYLLSKAMLHEANTPLWTCTRRFLLYLFWAIFVSMLIVATVILVQASRHFPPQAWWQKSVIYCLEPASFLDSNGDGVGDLEGVRQQLDFLGAIKIQVLVLGPIQKADLSGFYVNITEIDPVYGSLEDFQRLVIKAVEKGIHILLEIRDWDDNSLNSTGPPSSAENLENNETRSEKLMGALEIWLGRGVSGFHLVNTKRALLELAAEEWSAWWKDQRAQDGGLPKDNGILIVSALDGECEDLRARYSTGSGANASDAGIVISCALLGEGRNVSAQGVAGAVDEATLASGATWPGWTTGSLDPPQDEDLHRMLQVFLLTMPGTPLLQSSIEPGLATSHDWWREKKSRFQLLRTLLAMRSKELAFLRGDLFLLANTTETVAYLRSWTCSAFLVVLNFGAQAQVLDVQPPGFMPQAFIALGSRLDRRGDVRLQEVALGPFEALVLKLSVAGRI
ncbi:amino acid transporter heavy chain SLC3A2-like [Ambystoma mexicanum]|uniref:amino acid transporter heavy chain SLC3A2-like n=1 Tax=Ambystoma mexicanum TaxID=8296 RepID=UPI0037E8DBCB